MLSQHQSAKLQTSCETIYTAYSALSLAKASLADIQKAVNHSKSNIQITLDGATYRVAIQYSASGENTITISPEPTHGQSNLNLFCNQRFFIKDGCLGVIVLDEKNQPMELGGPGKIDLYPEHLDTLLKIKKHLGQGGDVSSMLIALATGSGKTFVQALWLLVLKITGMSGIFALPNQLVEQLKSDFSQLLPDSLVSAIKTLKEKNDAQNKQAIATLTSIANHSTKPEPKFIVSSYEILLDNHYAVLENMPSDEVVISFDEQHLVMEREDRKLKLKKLSKKMLAMFLTATPNEETYELCNRKPVSYMSSKEQAAAGYGLFPTIYNYKPYSINEKIEHLPSQAKPGMVDKAVLKLVDIFQPERTSPIQGLLEEFQYEDPMKYYDDNIVTSAHELSTNALKNFHKLRWGYQPPTSREILTIISDNEELINLNNYISETDYNGDFNNLCKNKPIIHHQVSLYSITESDGQTFDGTKILENHVYFYSFNNERQYVCRLNGGMICKTIGNSSDENEIKQILAQSRLDVKDEEKIYRYLASPEQLHQIGPFPIYQQGNRMFRRNAYLAMLQDDLDDKIAVEHSNYKKEEYTNKSRELENINPSAAHLERVSLATQLDHNIFSGIVDYLFSDLTGLSVIALNKERRDNFDSIFKKINDSILSLRSNYLTDQISLQQYYYDKLLFTPNNPKGLDKKGAKEIASIITYLVISFPTLLPEEKIHFIENWSMVNKGRDNLFKSKKFLEEFTSYAKAHRTLYVFENMDDAETPIEDSVPFNGFVEKVIKLRNADGTFNSEAKRREHSAVESLDDNTNEYQYKPNYLDGVTETIADNYSKLGFIGMYVSNKKTEGFSNLNLHTVINSIAKQIDSNNKPAKGIQGIGRLRRKDPTKKPYYYNTFNRDIETTFNLNALNKDKQYYPDYFKSEIEFNKKSLPYIGVRIATKIKEYIINNVDDYNDINLTAYNDAVQLIILHELRAIYNRNNHQLDISKEQLHSVLQYASRELKVQISHLKTAYRMSPMTNSIGKFVNFIAKNTYRFKTDNDLNGLVKKLKKSADEFQKLYGTIIQNSSYHLLSEKVTTFGELTLLFEKKIKYIEGRIKNILLDKLDRDDQIYFNHIVKKYYLPLLVKFIDPKLQSHCLSVANKMQNWHRLFTIHSGLIEEFRAEGKTPEELAEIAIKVFRMVPDLNHYLSEKSDKFEYSKDKIIENQKQVELKIKSLVTEGLISDLANYFKTDFLKQIKVLFIPADHEKIKLILSNGKNALDFARHIVNQENERSYVSSFKEFFKNKYPDDNLELLETVERRAKLANKKLEKINKKIKGSIKNNLSDSFSDNYYKEAALLIKKSERDELSNLIKTRLIPSLIKSFPSNETQEKISSLVDQYDDWVSLVMRFSHDQRMKDLNEIFNSKENNLEFNKKAIQELTVDMFKCVITEIAPEQLQSLNLSQEVGDYEAIAKQSLKAITAHFDAIQKQEVNQNIKLDLMIDYLSNEFLQDAAPLFISEHNGLINKILSDKVNATKLTDAIIGIAIDAMQKHLQNDFLSAIKPFYTLNDYHTIENILKNDVNARKFSEYLVKNDKTISDMLRDDPENSAEFLFISFFSENSNVKNIRSIKNRAEDAKIEFDQIVKLVTNSTKTKPSYCFNNNYYKVVASLLKETEQENINNLMNNQLLPCLVKNFEPSVQGNILKAMKGYNDWPELLISYQSHKEILALQDNTISDEEKLELFNQLSIALLADTKKISPADLAKQRNYVKACQQSTQKISNKMKEMTSPANLLQNTGAILSGLTASLSGLFSSEKKDALPVKETIGAALLAKYLQNEFLSDIEPLFTKNDLDKLHIVFSDKDAVQSFSEYIVKKALAGKLDDIKSDEVMALMVNFFSTYQNSQGMPYKKFMEEMKPAPMHMKNLAWELQNTFELYQSELSQGRTNNLYYFSEHPARSTKVIATLNDQYKTKIDKVAKGDLTAVLSAFFKEEVRDHIVACCNAYTKWPEFLLANQHKFEKLTQIEKSPKIALHLLQEIPGLNELSSADTINMSDCIAHVTMVLESGMEKVRNSIFDCLNNEENILNFTKKSFSESYPEINKLQVVHQIVSDSVAQLNKKSQAITNEFNGNDDKSQNEKYLDPNKNKYDVLLTLNPEVTTEVNDLVNAEVVPIFLVCIKDEKKEIVKRQCAAVKNWAYLLAKHKSSLEKFKNAKDSLEDVLGVVFAILNDVPGLNSAVINKNNDSIELNELKTELENSLKAVAEMKVPFNITAVNNLSDYLRKDFIDSLREVLLENDWNILKTMIQSKDNAKKLAAEIIKTAVENKLADKKIITKLIKNIFGKDPEYQSLMKNKDGELLFIDDLVESNGDSPSIIKHQVDYIKKMLAGAYQQVYSERDAIIKEELISVIAHDAFVKTVIDTLGHFTKDEIKNLLSVLPNYNSCTLSDLVSYADQLFNLTHDIKNKNFDGVFDRHFEAEAAMLCDKHMLPDLKDKNPSSSQLPFLDLWNMITELHKEQLRCHKYLNHQDTDHEQEFHLATKIDDVKLTRLPGIEQDQFKNEMSVVQLNAIRTSMPLNSAVGAAAQQKVINIVQQADEHIVEPLLKTLAENRDTLPYCAQTSRDINTMTGLHESAMRLGQRINHLHSLSMEQISNLTHTDAIDVLIKPITKKSLSAQLSDWWHNISNSQSVATIRFDAVKKIDKLVTYCDVTSNRSLGELYDATAHFLKNSINIHFSEHYSSVYALHRAVYANMVNNTKNDLMKNAEYGKVYENLLEVIQDNLKTIAQLPPSTSLKSHKFFSTTLNKIKDILFDTHLSVIEKLIRIQFAAIDYSIDPLHNASRCISQLFNKKKREEGELANKFCASLSNISLFSNRDVVTTKEIFFNMKTVCNNIRI